MLSNMVRSPLLIVVMTLLLDSPCITQSFDPSFNTIILPIHSSTSLSSKYMMSKTKEINEASPHNNNDMIQIAYMNLMKDISNMKTSRISKFGQTSLSLSPSLSSSSSSFSIKKRSSIQKKNEYVKLLSQNVNLCKLYYIEKMIQEQEEENRNYDYNYFTNMTNIVGPMYRRQIEMMLLRHPKLITHLLINLKNDIDVVYTNIISIYNDNNDKKLSKKTKNNNYSYIRLRPTSLRSVQDQILMDLTLPLQDQKRLVSTFKSKSTSFSKLNRKNLRDIFRIFYNIGMDDESLCKILIKAPQLFSYSAINIQQSIIYLKEIGLSNEDICKIVVMRPMVLAHCNKEGEKMDLIVQFFENELGLNCKSILKKYPQVFELNPDILVDKVQTIMLFSK